MVLQARRLEDLVSVGPAMVRDFKLLGIHSVAQLSRRSPEKMFERLCKITGQAVDLCCLDVFRAAVAQARNPHLAAEKCEWWYWSQLRKAKDAQS